ncbi:MAG: hypothetical protein ACK4S4_01945 [Pyrinomonadaceae bacterium]
MRTEPVHKDLSTSYVNLGSLILHLQQQRFVGRVKVELTSYESEIVFAADRMVYVRDCDLTTGLTTVGENAFRQTLKRSREPAGLISVFQADAQRQKKAPFVAPEIMDWAKRRSQLQN